MTTDEGATIRSCIYQAFKSTPKIVDAGTLLDGMVMMCWNIEYDTWEFGMLNHESVDRHFLSVIKIPDGYHQSALQESKGELHWFTKRQWNESTLELWFKAFTDNSVQSPTAVLREAVESADFFDSKPMASEFHSAFFARMPFNIGVVCLNTNTPLFYRKAFPVNTPSAWISTPGSLVNTAHSNTINTSVPNLFMCVSDLKAHDAEFWSKSNFYDGQDGHKHWVGASALSHLLSNTAPSLHPITHGTMIPWMNARGWTKKDVNLLTAIQRGYVDFMDEFVSDSIVNRGFHPNRPRSIGLARALWGIEAWKDASAPMARSPHSDRLFCWAEMAEKANIVEMRSTIAMGLHYKEADSYGSF